MSGERNRDMNRFVLVDLEKVEIALGSEGVNEKYQYLVYDRPGSIKNTPTEYVANDSKRNRRDHENRPVKNYENCVTSPLQPQCFARLKPAVPISRKSETWLQMCRSHVNLSNRDLVSSRSGL